MFSDLDHAFPSDARPPYMNSGDFSGVLGSNLELPCTPPRGRPAPVVRWKKNGSPLDLGRKTEPLLITHSFTEVQIKVCMSC